MQILTLTVYIHSVQENCSIKILPYLDVHPAH